MTCLRSLLGAVAVGVLLAPLASYAAEGRIPISAAVVITEPGSYFLSQDIDNLDSLGDPGHAITVNADHVTIDLDGHTIKVQGPYYAVVSTATDVEVRNGKLNGVAGGGADGVHFDRSGGEFRVRDLAISGFQGAGVWVGGCAAVEGARLIATGNTVKGGYGGIYIQCMEGSRIEQNQMRESFVGIWLENSVDSIISNNIVSQNSDDGILIANNSGNNTIERNIVTRNGGIGIHLYNSSANSVVHNNASKNGLAGSFSGIVLDGSTSSNYNQISYNTASFNTADGIFIDTPANFNTLDWNQCAGNTLKGMRFLGSNNVFSNNRARPIATGYFVGGAGNTNVQINTSPITPTNY